MAHALSPGYLKLVEDAQQRVRSFSIEEFLARLQAGERYILIDVREESEWARGHLPGDETMETGKAGTSFVAAVPVAIDMKLLKRGEDRYRIYCAPCHGQVGRGDGMIVRRGYRPPPSFHIDRLRAQPAGYYFDVVTAGFGAMPDYADKLSVADRWAVVAYVRALQLSQNATVADVPPDRRGDLAGVASAPAAPEAHHP